MLATMVKEVENVNEELIYVNWKGFHTDFKIPSDECVGVIVDSHKQHINQ